jgi:hypothetical protein
MAPRQKAQSFRAKIYKVGINRCVDVPQRVSRALGDDKYIPVKGCVEDVEIRSTLVPRGGGKYRLFVHSRTYEALGIDAGDFVRIRLVRDSQSRAIPVPRDLSEALRANKDAKAAFEKLAPGARRGFLRWVAGAKRSETRDRRIQEGMKRLIKYKKRC